MKHKRLFFSMLTLAIPFVLASCGSSESESSNSSDTPVTDTSPDKSNNDVEIEESQQHKIYLLAKNAGFTGTYEEWLNTIKGKSAYEIYCEYYPNYNGTESQWIDDLIAGKLYNNTITNDDTIQETGDFKYAAYSSDSYYLVSYSGADKYIDIPNYYNGFKISVIGDNAFKSNDQLTEIKLSNSIGIIGNSAFMGSKISKIHFNENLKSIGVNAFYNCNSLSTISLPNSLTSIKDYAFYCCTNLDNILIPDSVTEIGAYAFQQCLNAKNIVIGKKVCKLEHHTFWGCSSIEEVSIPGSVESIGVNCFSNCSKLTKVVIGNGVTTIYNNAFSSNKLSEITIPVSVTSIGTQAFTGTNILKIYYEGTIEQWNMIENVANLTNAGTEVTVICSNGSIDL